MSATPTTSHKIGCVLTVNVCKTTALHEPGTSVLLKEQYCELYVFSTPSFIPEHRVKICQRGNDDESKVEDKKNRTFQTSSKFDCKCMVQYEHKHLSSTQGTQLTGRFCCLRK